MGIKLPFYDEYIEFSDTVLKYNDLRSNYVLLANSTVSSALNIFLEFEEKYRNNGNYEEYIENLIFLIDGIIDKAIDFSLFVLMQYGVDSYNHDRLISYICNGEDSIYDKMGVSETISKLSNAIDEICGVQDRISEIRQLERSGRSNYKNIISRDLAGAISGEISAGIMNIGLGAVRGIKDAWTDSNDRVKIKNFAEDKLLNNDLFLSLIVSFRNPYIRCFDYIVELLCEKYGFEDILTKEYLATFEEYLSRIDNNVKFGYKEKAKSLIKDYLQMYPYEVDLYGYLFKMFGDDKCSIIRLATFFDISEEYKDLIDDKADCTYFENGNVDERIFAITKEYEEYKKAHLK